MRKTIATIIMLTVSSAIIMVGEAQKNTVLPEDNFEVRVTKVINETEPLLEEIEQIMAEFETLTIDEVDSTTNDDYNNVVLLSDHLNYLLKVLEENSRGKENSMIARHE
ncbi:hypothetical protein QA601_13970 [Chitinispirillales bacterium ANBcel5]|uniref:hypothetical protein n=1 Tax=Cellulosispirillum alkaliphilum TaxID=3039283 RepID=UPI002A506740|nr:hypothetical protein [Chitinispirillales bacterium ANBcel5]